MSWKQRAACRGRGDINWDEFGPVQIMLCAGCQVRPECLHAGLREVEACGTWGMTSEAQRHRIRNGKSKVADVWQDNIGAAEAFLAGVADGPTPTWQMR